MKKDFDFQQIIIITSNLKIIIRKVSDYMFKYVIYNIIYYKMYIIKIRRKIYFPSYFSLIHLIFYLLAIIY